MKIDKAIEVLERISESNDEDWLDFEYESIKLGIEALKEYKRIRALKFSPSSVPLPGETKE